MNQLAWPPDRLEPGRSSDLAAEDLKWLCDNHWRLPPQLRRNLLKLLRDAKVEMDPAASAHLRFADVAELEPRLADLLAEIQAVKDDRTQPYFCRNALWYGSAQKSPRFKRRLVRLVGWDAEQRGLMATRKAYDLAYRVLYEALPPCRGECSCLY
jgi:hypothetical protein